MPKMKTHKGIAKRFSKTGSGGIKFKHPNLRHCLEHKRKTQKNTLQKTGYLQGQDAKNIARLLG